MGKTIDDPDADRRNPIGEAGVNNIVPIPQQAPPLTSEQQAQVKALDEIFRRRREEYDKLSDEEKRQVEADWEQFRKSMNENHSGYRILYPD